METTRILVVGYPGAGKSTFATFLAKELGVAVINSGDALRAVLADRGIPVKERLNTGVLFLREFGERAAGEAIIAHARKNSALIVEGVRLFSTYKCFVDAGESVLVIFIRLRDTVRQRRFLQRSLESDEMSEKAAKMAAKVKDKYSSEVDRFLDVADFRFDNDGSREALEMFAKKIATAVKYREKS